MTTFSVIEARPYHVGAIIRQLRGGHARCLLGVGIDRQRAHREMLAVFGESAFRRSWMIDGKLAAVGGVTGSLLDPEGFVWLAFSEQALRFPKEIIRETRRQLEVIMETKRELATTILENDDVALRFAVAMGFHVGHDGVRLRRREQIQRIKADREKHIPVGGGFAVAMGFHLCA